MKNIKTILLLSSSILLLSGCGGSSSTSGVITSSSSSSYVTSQTSSTTLGKSSSSTSQQEFKGITFEDETVEYDGNYHTISPNNVPSGATVKYVGTKSYKDINTSGYKITVDISKSGYKTLRLSAKLYIVGKEFENLVFEDKTEYLDGGSHKIEVSGAPTGSTIVYKCLNHSGITNEASEAGVYNVQATVSYQYYNTKVLTATLTIEECNFISTDPAKTAYSFDSSVKYQELYSELSKHNVTIDVKYETVRTIKRTGEEYLRRLFSNTRYGITEDYYHSYYKSYNSSSEVDGIIIDTANKEGSYCFFTEKYYTGKPYTEKAPIEAFKETYQKYAYLIFSYADEGENGSFELHNIPGYVSNIPELSFEQNKAILVVHNYHYHSDDTGVDEPIINDERLTYTFYNIGNTKLDIPEDYKGKEAKASDYDLTTFNLDGIEYKTYSGESTAYIDVDYLSKAILKKNTFIVYPGFYGNIVKTFNMSYYKHTTDYTGYTLNLYIDSDRNYQGEYASYGKVSNGQSGGLNYWINYNGSVNYYGEW